MKLVLFVHQDFKLKQELLETRNVLLNLQIKYNFLQIFNKNGNEQVN